jgi:hypothetical protein
MLQSAEFYTAEGIKRLFVDGSLNMDKLVDFIAKGKMSDMIRDDVLEWQWAANFIVDNGEGIEWRGFTLTEEESREVFAKSGAQIREHLQQLAKGAAHRLQPETVQGVLTQATTVGEEDLPLTVMAPVMFAAHASVVPPQPLFLRARLYNLTSALGEVQLSSKDLSPSPAVALSATRRRVQHVLFRFGLSDLKRWYPRLVVSRARALLLSCGGWSWSCRSTLTSRGLFVAKMGGRGKVLLCDCIEYIYLKIIV